MQTRSGMKINRVNIHKPRKCTNSSILKTLRKLLKNIATVTRHDTTSKTYIVSYNWESAIIVQNICDDYVYLQGYNDVNFQYERKGELYAGLPNGYQTRY